jgi:hypothetical protein
MWFSAICGLGKLMRLGSLSFFLRELGKHAAFLILEETAWLDSLPEVSPTL